jgi:outer membrane biogenesis lipoprotein LolB
LNLRKAVFVLSTAILLTACGTSAEKRIAKADAKQTNEETKTMQQYKACLKKAKTDEAKLDACERLTKAM